MRAIIIGNGDIKNYTYIKSVIKEDDYIICADGGLKHLNSLGIKAHLVIGDFDSSSPEDNIDAIRYPVEKDMTDGEIAVNYAVDKGYSEIILVAMTGSRIDHTLTNIFLLTKSANISLIDDSNEIYVLDGKLELTEKSGKTLSIIPMHGNLFGVSSEGLKYKLDDTTLYFATGKGNSNVITDDCCRICAKEGIGIVIINDGE